MCFIKQRRISFVLGYLRMILWKISTAISIKHRTLGTFNNNKKNWFWQLVKSPLTESCKNKHIDGFYTKTTQEGGFSKVCVKIKKICYTDLLHFSTRKHNLVSFFENPSMCLFLHDSICAMCFLHQQTISLMRKRFPEWVHCHVVCILRG
jgi:hypothetical protein